MVNVPFQHGLPRPHSSTLPCRIFDEVRDKGDAFSELGYRRRVDEATTTFILYGRCSCAEPLVAKKAQLKNPFVVPLYMSKRLFGVRVDP